MSVRVTIWNKITVTVLALSALCVSWAETRSVAMVVPFAAGGATDQLWRVLEPHVNQELSRYNMKLVTEYRPGAGGMIAANSVAQATRTTVAIFSTALVIAPVVNPGAVQFAPRDLVLVAYAGHSDMWLLSAKHQSLSELQTACGHGPVTYGSSGVGSATHLFGHIIGQRLRCEQVTHVPYRGQAAAVPDLQAGRLDYVVDFAGSQSAKRIAFDWGTVPLQNWHVIVANASADSKDIARLQQAFAAVKSDPARVAEIQQRFAVTRFADERSTAWLQDQFVHFAKFVKPLVPSSQ